MFSLNVNTGCELANKLGLPQFCAGSRASNSCAGEFAAPRRTTDMARAFAALRLLCLVLAVVAWSVPSGVRAEDATQPPKQPPGATPSGQKAPEAGSKGNASNPPAGAEQHHLPPDSTTRQTVALPGRSLAFTATAGSIRLFDDKGEAEAEIAYHRLSTGRRRSGDATGDLSLQRRPRRGVRLSAIWRRRTLAAADHGRRGGFLRRTRSDAERRDLARLHRSRVHRSGRHRLQPLRRNRRRRAQEVLLGRRRRRIRSR